MTDGIGVGTGRAPVTAGPTFSAGSAQTVVASVDYWPMLTFYRGPACAINNVRVVALRDCDFPTGKTNYHNRLVARRAPSESASSFAQATSG